MTSARKFCNFAKLASWYLRAHEAKRVSQQGRQRQPRHSIRAPAASDNTSFACKLAHSRVRPLDSVHPYNVLS